MQRRHSIWIALGVLLISLLIWSVPRAVTWLAIDGCHDRGGSWHYDNGECSFTENYRGPAGRLKSP